MASKVKMKIAGVVIEMRSRFPIEKLAGSELKAVFPERFQNFYTKGGRKPDISIEVKIARKLPELGRVKRLFVMWRKPDRSTNWQLYKTRDGYAFKCNIMGKRQVMFINEDFNRVSANLLPSSGKRLEWYPSEIIYDFMQILLIHYLARRKTGFFIHCSGIKDRKGRGYVFAGRSEAGKTTLSRILFDQGNVKLLNDDRVAVRKSGGRYYIYGIPWHGEFTDYMKSHPSRARLERIYFIRHAGRNTAKKLSASEVFPRLYPTIFLPFWDREGLDNISSFCAEMAGSVGAYDMGFIKSPTVAGFIDRMNRRR